MPPPLQKHGGALTKKPGGGVTYLKRMVRRFHLQPQKHRTSFHIDLRNEWKKEGKVTEQFRWLDNGAENNRVMPIKLDSLEMSAIQKNDR